MPFRYSCFISYRHGQRKLAERIINDLYDALANEIETFLNEEVFVDRERLKGGTFYNEELASALCESACMIVVFTPTYFDKKHTFCAREYRAMEQLEQRRLAHLGKSVDKRLGLIIPIVFRGGKYIPAEIKERRQFYSFEDFQLGDVEISRHPNYATKIKEIAEYVADRFRVLSALPNDVCQGCSEFKLPTDADIDEWLSGMVSGVAPCHYSQQNCETARSGSLTASDCAYLTDISANLWGGKPLPQGYLDSWYRQNLTVPLPSPFPVPPGRMQSSK